MAENTKKMRPSYMYRENWVASTQIDIAGYRMENGEIFCPKHKPQGKPEETIMEFDEIPYYGYQCEACNKILSTIIVVEKDKVPENIWENI